MSQPWHCEHSEPGKSLLWEPALSIADVQQQHWPLPSTCQWYTTSRDDKENCLQALQMPHWGDKLYLVENQRVEALM